LGSPSNAVMALLLGAFMIHGVTPGPLLIPKHPELFWGVVASMYIGNVMLVILNLPMVGLWVKILNIPYKYLFPLILYFCCIGGFSINNDVFDIKIMIIFGVIGYILQKFKYELVALVLAFVLGPMIETSLRQSLLIGDGNILIFLSRPIAAFFCILTILLLLSTIFPQFNKVRRVVPKAEE
jgi:putative tricarboxylic transport membrane protein